MPKVVSLVPFLFQTLDFDRDGLTKLKKAIKAIHNSGNGESRSFDSRSFSVRSASWHSSPLTAVSLDLYCPSTQSRASRHVSRVGSTSFMVHTLVPRNPECPVHRLLRRLLVGFPPLPHRPDGSISLAPLLFPRSCRGRGSYSSRCGACDWHLHDRARSYSRLYPSMNDQPIDNASPSTYTYPQLAQSAPLVIAANIIYPAL
jgi:hypothetical protein